MKADKQNNDDESSGARLLLNAYYETLYELLLSNRELLEDDIDFILKRELKKFFSDGLNDEKYCAYRDACIAFVDERLELYNPTGIQYTFDRLRSKEAIQLEHQLNWYGSRDEFKALIRAVGVMALQPVTDEQLSEMANELINKLGAFPDKSIISAYKDKPALNKIPDFVVATAIEKIIRR